MTDTDKVREHARREYVEPARARRQSTVRILVGDVQKAVRLTNRVPLICQALKSNKFLTENHLALEGTEGPPSGISTTVAFTYRILDNASWQGSDRPEEWAFGKLRGVAQEVFQSLGGGEAFLRQERERFYASDETR